MIWCLKPSDFCNLAALAQSDKEKKGDDEIHFGTSRRSSHGTFWHKLIAMGLASEKQVFDPKSDSLKEIAPEAVADILNSVAIYKPTAEGKQLILNLLHPALNTGWPPKDSVIVPEAIEMLQKYVEEQNAPSQSKLAYLLERGIGIEINLERAFTLHLAAAEKGIGNSMDAVGEMYMRAQGTSQNNKESFKWFRMAADNGNRPSMVKIGHVYNSSQDYIRAYIWYSLAVKHGLDYSKERDDVTAKLPKEQLQAAHLFIEVWSPDGT